MSLASLQWFPAVLLCLAACECGEDPAERPGDSADTEETGEPEDTGDTTDTGDTDIARWTVMIFMNGDNDLEAWVNGDLNELEMAGSGDGVHLVVQADRHEDYSTNGGDWTDTRRYYITADDSEQVVHSEIVQEMGELDMGIPETLSDFLLWAAGDYPAEHYALIMWDHGEGWMFTDSPALPGVSWDQDTNNDMSIAQGELQVGIQPFVDAYGELDILAFDACNMAAWEVAHAFKDQANFLVGSEATVGMEGFLYDQTFASLKANQDWTAGDLATDLAQQAVEQGGEWHESAVDMRQIEALSQAIDALAGAVLDDPSLEAPLLEARSESRGTDLQSNDWYMDIGDLASVLQERGEPELAQCGDELQSTLDASVTATFGNQPFSWASGLNILFDERWLNHLRDYHEGEGATWAQDTRWDDLLLQLNGN